MPGYVLWKSQNHGGRKMWAKLTAWKYLNSLLSAQVTDMICGFLMREIGILASTKHNQCLMKIRMAMTMMMMRMVEEWWGQGGAEGIWGRPHSLTSLSTRAQQSAKCTRQSALGCTYQCAPVCNKVHFPLHTSTTKCKVHASVCNKVQESAKRKRQRATKCTG